MALAKDYASVMSRKGEIMKKALGMDFSAFESGSIAFDYEKMMSSTGFSMEEVERVQGLTAGLVDLVNGNPAISLDDQRFHKKGPPLMNIVILECHYITR